MKTIIKGLIYSDGAKLLRPIFSGNFFMVDCTEYLTKKDIKELYEYTNSKELLKGFYITFEGVKYYECEVSPQNTKDMELLSDISEVEHYDNETDF